MYIKVHMYRVSYKWLSPGSEITVKNFFFFYCPLFLQCIYYSCINKAKGIK